MRYKKFIAILLTATLWSCISIPLPEKWDKDYYSYHVGAYINGVEYHEPQIYQTTVFAKSHSVGYHCIKKDNWFFISQVDPYLFLSSSPDGKGVSIWDITASFDAESYDPNKQYSFTTDNLDDYDEWHVNSTGLLYDGNKQEIDAPWCLCLISYEDKYYVSKDGWISFGEFENGSNAGTIHFECTAVSEEGDTLHITNGYIGRYCEKCYRW